MAKRMTTKERFWAKVQKTENCWIWTASLNEFGYGVFRTDLDGSKHKAALAHRVSWIICNGPIEPKQNVLHSCDNPPCIRPDHLFTGTKLDNTQDMIAKKRHVGIVSQKLTIESVEKIRIDPRRNRVIAEEYGICKSHVSKIKLGKNWKHRAIAVLGNGEPIPQ